MNDLAAFQDAFAAALAGDVPEGRSIVAALAVQPGFAVYRNTTIKGCIDALQASFPAVARLTGEEWFRAAAREHVRDALPQEPSLLAYGRSFPDFLASFPPAAGLPYLADVARLDRMWTEAHVAADAPVLTESDLAGIDPAALARARLVLHPAARWRAFADMPAYSIWRANREGDGRVDGVAWRGEAALLTRPRLAVESIAVDPAAAGFLDACAAKLALADALDAALAVDPRADLARIVATLVEAGAATLLVPDPLHATRFDDE